MNPAAAESGEITAQTRCFLAWASLWSTLADDDEQAAAWQALGLPGCYADQRLDYWNTFHVGTPQPAASLLLHALLQRDGTAVREEMLRIADYLDLEIGLRRLPPDHLAPVCELLAVAIERQEDVLCEGLRSRYLLPWIDAAEAHVGTEGLAALLARFRQDLAAASEHPHTCG